MAKVGVMRRPVSLIERTLANMVVILLLMKQRWPRWLSCVDISAVETALANVVVTRSRWVSRVDL